MAVVEGVLKRAGGPEINTEDSLSKVDEHPTTKEAPETIRTTAAVGPAVSGIPVADLTMITWTTSYPGYPHYTFLTLVPISQIPSTDDAEPTETTTDDVDITTTHKKTTARVTATITSSAVSESSTSEITESISSTLIEADPTGGSQTTPTLPTETRDPKYGAKPQPEEEAHLPTRAIVGISVGCGIAGLMVLFMLCWYYRIMRRARRASAACDAPPPAYDDDRFVGVGTSLSQPTGLTKTVTELNKPNDVFAPFGGRANSQRGLPNPLFSNPPPAQTQLGESSSRGRMSMADAFLNSPTSVTSGNQPVSPLFPGAAGNDATRDGAADPGSPGSGHEARSAIAKELTMVRPESQPRCIELDSSGDGASAVGTAAPSELPTPSPSATRPNSGVSSQAGTQGPPLSKFHDARSKLSQMAMTHPAPLVPGFSASNTQTSIQSRMEDAASAREQQDASSESSLQRRDTEFRANLNPTEDERDNNQHVTSWEKL